MSRIVQRLVADRKRVELETGSIPGIAHIGRDLWRDLCAETGTGDLPAGAYVELDGCRYEFRDVMAPTALYFESGGHEVGVHFDPEGKSVGWASQLEKNKWKPLGPDMWERDGKQRCSTEEAIAIETREAAARASIKRSMASFASGPAKKPYRTEDGLRVPNIDWSKP